jgi:ribonuclease PH
MQSVYQQLRPDGRDWNHLRPISIELNTLTRSDGSCKLKLGSTVVISSVTGPLESKMNQKPLEILIRPSNGVPLEKHRLLEDQFIQILLPECSAISPNSTINVFCEILVDDGSSVAALFNALVFALISAGVCLRSTPLAVAVAQTSEGCRILDPSLSEERANGVSSLLFDAVSGKVLGLIGGSPSSSVFEALAIGSDAVVVLLEIARVAFKSHLASLTVPRRV